MLTSYFAASQLVVVANVLSAFLNFCSHSKTDMSGMKRKIEGTDPDYEDISQVRNNKRNKTAEHDGKQIQLLM